jgi:hypothetical protein
MISSPFHHLFKFIHCFSPLPSYSTITLPVHQPDFEDRNGYFSLHGTVTAVPREHPLIPGNNSGGLFFIHAGLCQEIVSNVFRKPDFETKSATLIRIQAHKETRIFYIAKIGK